MICKLYLPQERVPVTVRKPIAPDYTVDQAASARACGCSVGGYVWCYRDIDPRTTIIEALDTADLAGLDFLTTPGVFWLDVETYKGSWPDLAWLHRAVNAATALGLQPGIYTGHWMWRDYLGESEDFGELPLWAAEYDTPPDLASVTPFGGWTAERILGHQYSATGVDQSVFDPLVV